MKRTMSKAKLKRLAKKMGGRGAIAEALGVSAAAVHRYFSGYGMRAETFDLLTGLVKKHDKQKRKRSRMPEPDLVPEPPTLEEEGGHLFRLLSKALARNSGVEALGAQLDRMERRLDRIEANQQSEMKAWQMDPAEVVV